MGIIDIVEGSFPVQAVLILPKTSFTKNTVMMVKTYGKEKLIYSLRSAVKSLEIVIDHKMKPTIKVMLSDGNVIIGKADHKTIEQIKIAQALGPDTEPAVMPFQSHKEKKRLQKAAKSDQNVKTNPLTAAILIIVVPLIFIWIGQSGSSTSSTYSTSPSVSLTPEQIAQQEKAAQKQRAASYLDQVRAFVSFLITEEDYFKTSKASDADMDKIRKTLVLIESLADSLNSARQNKADLSAEDTKYLKGIETRLSSFQQRVLPGLRLAFRKRADELLWEHDVDVSVSGKGNTIVTFTGSMFAANANIKAVQTQLDDVAERLRFKQTRFRWYREADEYTYFKLDTPPDGKLAIFKFGAFQDIAEGYR